MFYTSINEISAANTCIDGTGSHVVELASALEDGWATIKFTQAGNNTATKIRIWRNNCQHRGDSRYNCLEAEASLAPHTKNKAGGSDLSREILRFKVRKDDVLFATMTVAQADPITILTTIETN
jgi:hypothetical protein